MEKVSKFFLIFAVLALISVLIPQFVLAAVPSPDQVSMTCFGYRNLLETGDFFSDCTGTDSSFIGSGFIKVVSCGLGIECNIDGIGGLSVEIDSSCTAGIINLSGDVTLYHQNQAELF